jgi:hypothetical protein
MFANENEDQFPMQISTNKGGTMEWTRTRAVYRHFQIISNELGAPQVLRCPQDTVRTKATNFFNLGNGNLSYLIEQNAKPSYLSTMLVGDSPFTLDGATLSKGCFLVATQQALSWGKTPHGAAGNIGLTDGSVAQTGSDRLTSIRHQQQIATNWLAIP